MNENLEAKNLSLKEVHHILQFKRHLHSSFNYLPTIEQITKIELKKLEEISLNFYEQYAEHHLSKEQIKLIVISPLMWMAGFYHPTIHILLQENIAVIKIKDENTIISIIKGQMDILSVSNGKNKAGINPQWILLIETQNSSVNATDGLPQLLTYAYKSLEIQKYVWGLTTNGMDYQFVFLQQGTQPTYHLFPKLDITRPEHAVRILKTLKAIRNLYEII
ncbi:MAG: restriction endonuclease subunit R [Nostocaceae cyanobacterium]|nr:restriction endonuclease subunit R [Nostocaceae cyanobacterium]